MSGLSSTGAQGVGGEGEEKERGAEGGAALAAFEKPLSLPITAFAFVVGRRVVFPDPAPFCAARTATSAADS